MYTIWPTCKRRVASSLASQTQIHGIADSTRSVLNLDLTTKAFRFMVVRSESPGLVSHLSLRFTIMMTSDKGLKIHSWCNGMQLEGGVCSSPHP